MKRCCQSCDGIRLEQLLVLLSGQAENIHYFIQDAVGIRLILSPFPQADRLTGDFNQLCQLCLI